MRWLILVVALALGCSKETPRGKQPTPTPIETADAALAVLAVADAAPAAAAGECTRDDECVVTTWPGCCTCCNCVTPHAEPRARTVAAREICARKDCGRPVCTQRCGKCEFTSFKNDDDRPGKCVAGACVMP